MQEPWDFLDVMKRLKGSRDSLEIGMTTQPQELLLYLISSERRQVHTLEKLLLLACHLRRGDFRSVSNIRMSIQPVRGLAESDTIPFLILSYYDPAQCFCRALALAQCIRDSAHPMITPPPTADFNRRSFVDDVGSYVGGIFSSLRR